MAPSSLRVGLDIGGTKLMVAAADPNGNVVAVERRPTPSGWEEGLELLHGMIGLAAGGRKITAIGASAGGPLDFRTGIISPLHQLQWRDVPIKSLMQSRYGCPFAVEVDTDAAALAEYGAREESVPRLLYITLSTGMGGGLVLDGQLYRGSNGCHPEIGHQSVPVRCAHPGRARCACGAEGCLEALVSGNGIRRTYGKPAENLDPSEWAEVAWNFGQGLRNLAVLYAPEVIAVGGGVAIGAGDAFLSRAADVMREHLRLVPAPRVELSSLGYDTALRGALELARRLEEQAP
jgi:predicted NBD/HSP70 family sugar kinase